MKRVHRKLFEFIGALVALTAIAFWLFRINLNSLLSVGGAVIFCSVFLLAFLSTLVRGGTTVRFPFRFLAGFLSFAFLAASALCTYLFFTSAQAALDVLISAITFALIGASSACVALTGHSPYSLLRGREQDAA